MPVPKIVQAFGRAWTVQDLADHAGIKVGTFRARLQKGWSPEEAAGKPLVNNQPEDLTGQVFGRLTAIHLAEKTHPKIRKWACRCACGRAEMVVVAAMNLKSGAQRSCGCLRQELAAEQRKRTREDLTGKVFGNGAVVVVGLSEKHRVGPGGGFLARWDCRCLCGSLFQANANALRAGDVQSCGCGITYERKREKFTLLGEEVTIPDMAELAGLGRDAITYRIKTMGLTPEEAVVLPRYPRGRGRSRRAD